MAEAREVWITGIGIVTCLGESLDAHWQGLSKPLDRGHDVVCALYRASRGRA